MASFNQALRPFDGLTLVGVGPGDPSLLTLAAVEAIKNATLIAYPVARKGADGMAAKIAYEWIEGQKRHLPLIFPMVTEVEPRKRAWREAGDELATAVFNGERVAFLSQGDVSLFSTSSYLLIYLKANHPGCPIRLIPGITGLSAAAAAAAWPLTLQQDQLLILPTPEEPKTLEALLVEAASTKRVIVLLKLGHRWIWVRPLLERMDLLHDAVFAQRIGWPDEQIVKASKVDQSAKPYFSLLLVRQSWPDLMP